MPAPRSDGSARVAAARAISAVVDEGVSLKAALATLDTTIDDARVRAAMRDLAFNVLRHWRSLEREISAQFARPMRRRDHPLRAVMAIACFELKRGSEPAYAVVNSATENARALGFSSAVGFVNAVLRNVQRNPGPPLDPSGIADHPPWLVDQLRADWPAQLSATLEANLSEAPIWLRLNRAHPDAAAWAANPPVWAAANDESPSAYRLNEKRRAELLPGFAEGLLSVQDVSAQLAAPLLGARAGERVLDACAAPGGKTAHLQELADNALDLLALDLDPQRAARVSETLTRLGRHAELSIGDGRTPADWFDGRPFDHILLDAPCSGLGVVRRHPDILALRRADDLPAHAQRQRELLDALWPLLNPGGTLLYTTCTWTRLENVDQVRAFLQRHADAACEPLNVTGVDTGFGVQRFPGDGGGDGFFYARLRKLA
jgi:16S rRNA (cytosine967-C5)-methyltransferase